MQKFRPKPRSDIAPGGMFDVDLQRLWIAMLFGRLKYCFVGICCSICCTFSHLGFAVSAMNPNFLSMSRLKDDICCFTWLS